MKNKRLVFSLISLVLITVIIIAVMFLGKGIKDKKNKVSKDTAPETSSVYVNDIENTESNTESATDEIADNGTGLILSEPAITVPDNRTGEKAEKPAEAKQPVVSSEKTVSTVTPTDKQYVQDADPNTGISWDGKSAIVYRYADGSTSTEKRNGGYYEIRPNVWVLYSEPIVNIESDGTCDFCGRVMGDGKNGTCVRWMMGDVTCPNCGQHVKGNTCHTCEE